MICISCANELAEQLRTKAIIADKVYDSDAFVQGVHATGPRSSFHPARTERPDAPTVVCFTAHAISSSAFSTASNNFVVSQLVMTNSLTVTLCSLRLRRRVMRENVNKGLVTQQFIQQCLVWITVDRQSDLLLIRSDCCYRTLT